MSIRAREKALVLADTFEKDFYAPGITLAKVSGFAFLMIGSLVTLTQLAELPIVSDVCDGQLCNTAQVSGAVNTDSTEPADQDNYVELLTDIPDVITDPVGLAMQFSSAEDTYVYIRQLSEGGYVETELTAVSIGNDKYEATVDPTQLIPDQYELMVSVQHENTTTPTVYSLGFFAVLEDTDTVASTDTASTTDVIQPSEDTTPSDETPDNTEPEPVTKTAPEKADDTAGTTDNSETTGSSVGYKDSTELLAISDSSVSDAVEPIATPTTTTEADNQLPIDELVAIEQSLTITTNKTHSGLAEVMITSAKQTDIVSFYIRPTQTLNTQTLGQAILGMSTFKFDTTQFPDGEYQIYAEYQRDQNTISSNKVEFVITNAPARTLGESVTAGSERELLRISEVIQNSNEDSAQLEPALDSDSPGRLEFTVQDRVRELIASDSETLDRLFENYAVAQQSGDPALINEAQNAIQNYQERLLTLALRDERDRLFAKELELGLDSEFNKLMQNVQTFEAVRKERSEANATVDTDGDGISDFDEITLYKTDPNQADSDNDGFTDGVEIIKGFNPNDAAAEAVIVYQSPKESAGVVTTQKLQVSEVLPEVELSANDGVTNVRAVVKGIGLPNSFVTLYVFSTPTIVTVRTEADGTFEYTFTKELEDGQHEVFVALTDNAGAIVAQSEQFTFVKEAQAFTPVDAQEVSNTLITPNTTSDFSPYRIVLGMSVFALGILLILLGVGLRGNKPDAVILQDKPA